MLEVRIRDDRSDRIENQAALDGAFPVRIERQVLLKRQEAEAHSEHHNVEYEHRDDILLPVLRLTGETASEDMEQAVEAARRACSRGVWVHGPFHVTAQGRGQDGCAADDKSDKYDSVHKPLLSSSVPNVRLVRSAKRKNRRGRFRVNSRATTWHFLSQV